jgi:hypothetical protein
MGMAGGSPGLGYRFSDGSRTRRLRIFFRESREMLGETSKLR